MSRVIGVYHYTIVLWCWKIWPTSLKRLIFYVVTVQYRLCLLQHLHIRKLCVRGVNYPHYACVIERPNYTRMHVFRLDLRNFLLFRTRVFFVCSETVHLRFLWSHVEVICLLSFKYFHTKSLCLGDLGQDVKHCQTSISNFGYLTKFCSTSVTLIALSYLYKIRSLIPRTFSFLEMLFSTEDTTAFSIISFVFSRNDFTCSVGLHLLQETSRKNGHDCNIKWIKQ